MKNYNDLELTILSCLLQKSELMEEVKLEDKHFKKYHQLWVFMKAVYEKFGDFDISIMATVSKNKFKIMDYIELLIDKEPAPSRFNLYQDLLIELYNQSEKEKYIKERIYELATDLYVGNITNMQFKEKLKLIYQSAELIERKNK